MMQAQEINPATNGTDEYEGTDLDAMSHAGRYSSWIADEMRPYLGKRILEVGSGTGSFARILLEQEPELFVALEPSRRMFSRLKDALPTNSQVEIRTLNATLSEAKNDLADSGIDSIVYMNVLEHIEDHAAELQEAFSLLRAGGALCIYVPALPALYGPFDKRVGHFRRYTKDSLRQVAVGAGFDDISVRYRDLAGVVPFWVHSKILGYDRLEPAAVKLYDRMIPLVRLIDGITRAPIGKNLLLLARKPT